MVMLNSSIVKGWVRHRRYAPKAHEFEYDMAWTLLDLDKVEEQFSRSRLWSIEKANFVSYRAKDFHQGIKPSLSNNKYPKENKQKIISSIKSITGKEFSGKVYMMSHLRNYGYNFNSVCFYYCYDLDQKLAFIVSEITNTPWSERHSYVFDCAEEESTRSGNVYQFSFKKEFHVSPFIQMDMLYRWTFKVVNDELRVHMAVLTTEGKKYFDATFTGQLLPLTTSSMRKYVFTHALQPHKMSFLIYWQALKLWLKRLKVFDHPKDSQS